MPRIISGLLCDKHGRPVAVEVFSGELHDDTTLPSQVSRLQDRFGLARVTVAADRGMVTKANIETLAGTEGVSWITALHAPTIKRLARAGVFQPSLFAGQNLGEITNVAEFPGERLIVCGNRLVGAQRARKRQELLDATEQELELIKARVDSGTLLGAAQIGLAAGPALKGFHVKKHFEVQITDMHVTSQRKHEQIAEEAALDGFSILRTNLTDTDAPAGEVVRADKNLEQAERALRSIKGPDLQIRPIDHRLEDRVRSHVPICMLADYLTWHLKAAWKPLLFTDEDRPVNDDPVAKPSAHPRPRPKPERNAPATTPRRTAPARFWPTSQPRHGTGPGSSDEPTRSRSSPSPPHFKPARSSSPPTRRSSPGRHDPDSPKPA